MNKSRSLLTLSLSVVAIAALPVAAQAATAGASGACGQFRVMHNDKISGVSFPAGPYNMVNSGMSCAQTTKYFQQFLEAGKVAKGWQVKTLSGNRKRFTKLGTNPTVDFQATAASDPTPTPTPGGLTCPGTFRVLHNDQIGAMKLPAGSYTITLASHNTPGLDCASASHDFTYFLNNDWAGNLPRPWKMNVAAKSFYMNNTPSDGFSVKRVGS
jgi:hypothetical protein